MTSPSETAAASTPEAAPMHVQRRLIAAAVATGAATVLGLAAWVSPAREGYGTHTQLGLPPCGFELATGLPCATCGMTTSFAHAAEGNFLASFLTQPAGFVLAVLTAVALIVGTLIAITGADPRPLRKLWSVKTVVAMGGLLIAAWCYKLAVTLGGLA
ncbi:MAG: DUF2752 domain-containing protein [Planctomycetota bacterium]